MNILALDYGSKRIGLAWAQKGFDVVLPFGIVKNTSLMEALSQIEKMVRDQKIDTVIVGIPLTLEDGSENDNTARVREFGQLLGKRIDKKVIYRDERLSSQMADRMGGSVSRDEKAAMCLLQSFLDSLN